MSWYDCGKCGCVVWKNSLRVIGELVSEWVAFNIPLEKFWSFRSRVFPNNQLHWYCTHKQGIQTSDSALISRHCCSIRPNVTSSIKLEVHNISWRHQKRTEPRDLYTEFCEDAVQQFQRYAREQTHTHTHRERNRHHTTPLPYGVE